MLSRVLTSHPQDPDPPALQTQNPVARREGDVEKARPQIAQDRAGRDEVKDVQEKRRDQKTSERLCEEWLRRAT